MSTLTASADVDVTDDRRTRTAATGLALILGPLLLIVGNLLSTPGDSSTASFMTRIAGSSGAEQISIILFIGGFTMFLPAAFGIVALLPRRGSVLGLIGAWLTAIGAMAYAGLETTGVANIGLARALPATQAAHLVDVMGNVGAAGVIFLLGLGLPIGMILVTCAARRGRLTPTWVPIVTALGFIAVIVVETTIGGIAGDVLMLAGLGYLGLGLLKGTQSVL
ncbi:MAG TPA: hypothetical protein VGF84_04090 [Micromonosporaceae bacterium]